MKVELFIEVYVWAMVMVISDEFRAADSYHLLIMFGMAMVIIGVLEEWVDGRIVNTINCFAWLSSFDKIIE